ncbi:pseudouridine synthase [Vibrio sp. WJH972]
MTKQQLESYFHPFGPAFTLAERPKKFTYPFCYQPHPLCIEAATLLQDKLQSGSLWQTHRSFYESGEPVGKMFGVMVVETESGELGYLAAFSGKLADSNHHEGFVPPVYDILNQDNIFVDESSQINVLNQKISILEASEHYAVLQQKVEGIISEAKGAIEKLQQDIRTARAQRKQQRSIIESAVKSNDGHTTLNTLAQQSINEKRELKQTKQRYSNLVAQAQCELDDYQNRILTLKNERKTRSNALQHTLFSNYQFLNAKRQPAILVDLFKDTLTPTPPAGSGECAAPKLLQFAYEHQFRPIAMAEFWWGDSPKSEIRRHGKYYPSCNSKCLPILTHMLEGLDVEPNPLLSNHTVTKDIDIIYQDDAIVVINKPQEMLSVPGVHIKDSAFTRLESILGEREQGPYVVHRLDMSTSGLLVFALTRRANKSLQKQFITRHVEKRYIALVEGIIEHDHGEISLPLAADINDKPRQLVCEKRGKAAHTTWQVIARKSDQTLLYLYPHTGRTHQLRVHCSHPLGLNFPIVGDDLYGDRKDRLHLHAEQLSFDHPYTKARVTFDVPCQFTELPTSD